MATENTEISTPHVEHAHCVEQIAASKFS